MTHSFLERIGNPEVDLANDREESVPFNVLDATFLLEFSSSQMFSMLFRDSLAFRNSQGRSGDAKKDQEDSLGDEVLATDQGERGRMVSENVLAVGIRSPVLLYLVFVSRFRGFPRFWGEPGLLFRKVFRKRVLTEKSRARFIALPVAKSLGKVFDFLKGCIICNCFDQAFCGYELE
ncbi:hypothetical protein DY000_02032664 [Brassica cretica]|uniref:Uncharacterized protein n=1 Tax=Brassica cretica TaxID=69181 RepID=A0ABQ7DWT2_BRACR|nr:hypothetical protein DY000_02032664 [Brassica cretica]